VTASLAVQPAPAVLAPVRPPRPGIRSWMPLVLLGAPAMYAVHHYGAGGRDLVVFGAYVFGLVAVPGVLLWRAGRQRARSLAEDFGPGLALGYVLEVLAYFAARALGQPRAVVLAPIAVLVVFLAVRPLRRYWRAAPDAERAPIGWIWANAGIAAGVLIWAALFFLRVRGVDYAFNDGDLPFQLALIGELRHHMPPQVPWVQGEALSYHWFAYADIAATSWVTGVDAPTLLMGLYFVPLLGALPFAVSSLARQVTGRWWPGPLAALITLAGVAPYPYGWPAPPSYRSSGLGPVEDGVMLRLGLFASPTQTFAALLGIGLVMVLIDLLRSAHPGRRGYLLLAAFVAVICGAKATYLPIILCGLVLALAGTLITGRRRHRPALGAVAVVIPGLLFAQLVLFRGEAQGMVIAPLAGLSRYSLGAATGLGAVAYGPLPPAGPGLALITVVTLLTWTMIWGGAAFVLTGDGRRDPAHLLMAGIGVAALAAVLLVEHYGFGQTWFLVAARPYLAVAAVAGLAALLGRPRAARVGGWLPVAVLIGIGIAWVTAALGRRTAPTVRAEGLRQVLIDVAAPQAVLVAAVLAATAAAWLIGRRVTALRGRAAAVAVAIAMMVGISLYPSGVLVAGSVRHAAAFRFAPASAGTPLWPVGTRSASAWLRRHSDPDDLVATNAHCRPAKTAACDNLHFWFTAFTERRFLVEGWGFTPTANRLQSETGVRGNAVPYWDVERLAANDAAFHRPGAGTVGVLRDTYRVRWLFVDLTDPAVRADLLAEHATLRYRSGMVALYRL
jgi:hypothetical protein